MHFNHKCPYCDSEVSEYIHHDEYGVYTDYCFVCNCTKGDMSLGEETAYRNYLFEREQNNITNFDIYFGMYGTEEELTNVLDKYCRINEGNCDCCVWSDFVRFFILRNSNKVDCYDCTHFWRWLRQKGVEHEE